MHTLPQVRVCHDHRVSLASGTLDDDHQSTELLPTRPLSAADAGGALLFVLLATVLIARLNKGLDLSDESYYALFVDDWLKGGIDSSSYLVIHQTAALLTLPFAWLFREVNGSTSGMFLFLRHLFLGGAVISAGVVVFVMRRLVGNVHGWLAGLLLLGFIPFGLPAPSYNTIGLQALCVALAAYGNAITYAATRRATWWLAASAAAWTVATVAYPPLMLALFVQLGVLLILRNPLVLRTRRYVTMALIAQGLGWSLVATALSPSRIVDSIRYTARIGEPGGASTKLRNLAEFFTGSPWFAALCVAAVGVGVARRRLPSLSTTLLVPVLIGVTLLHPPRLFLRSHDAITLLVLMGVGTMWDLRKRTEVPKQAQAIMYTVAVAAGLATTVFATNLLYNFCIGAAFAAPFAFGSIKHGVRHDALSAVAALAVIAVVVVVSLSTFYGDMSAGGHPRVRIEHGFFAGIDADQNDAELLAIVDDRVRPLVEGASRVVYVGRNPGAVLALPVRLQMLSSYPLAAGATEDDHPEALDVSESYYESPENRPRTVIIYRDPLFVPANPMGDRFDEWYELIQTEKTPIGVLEIYRSRDEDETPS